MMAIEVTKLDVGRRVVCVSAGFTHPPHGRIAGVEGDIVRVLYDGTGDGLGWLIPAAELEWEAVGVAEPVVAAKIVDEKIRPFAFGGPHAALWKALGL